MLQIIPNEMKAFMTPGPNEEAIDQPLYHLQAYGTGGATSFTFFQTAKGSATNGLADTNMNIAGALSVGQKFVVMSIGVYFIGSAPQVNNAGASTASSLNDSKKVLEGIGSFSFFVLNKDYLDLAPLSALPSGMGTFVGGAAYQATQTSGAPGDGFISYGTNGLPVASARYQLRCPIPIPAQVTFSAVINFPTAITVTTASRMGVYLWGMLIRAKQ